MSDIPGVDWAAMAQAWIDADPDPNTQSELAALVAAADNDALADRVGGELAFGTAGLRGIVGAGSNRMNRAVVTRTTRGLADYLLDRMVDSRTLPVIVGHDARLTSREFAETTAGVLVAAGLVVRYFDRPVPTPLVAYAAKQLGAIAAVAITASHNPAEYNGYKVYAANAAQLNAPANAEIAKRIAAAGAARSVRCVEGVFSGAHPRAEPISEELFERYLAELDTLRDASNRARDLRVVYTPLHGVGARFVERTFRRAGYSSFTMVAEQAEPDGTFPTAPFPNPEEPHVLDLAVRDAVAARADLVLANDPDADRLSVCIPTPSGRFTQLTGDQIGILLADDLLSRASPTPTPLVVSTVVSSPMIERIAAAYGARSERTLTGFKWICNAGLALERDAGVRFVFGYEEALGYALPMVRDKDGISAALLFADIAARCRGEGRSVRERLDELYRRHGLWVSHPRSLAVAGWRGAARIAAAMARIRTAPPTQIAGIGVERIRDFSVPEAGAPSWRGAADVVELHLDGGSRVLLRPSGTEPKLKIYTEVHREIRDGQDVRVVEAELGGVAEAATREVAESLDLW
ncbi:MAG: phospho-sugar mutase [Polyangiaceae bacterium]|nr:phospho-sugar mutase [Polyangiaceae bacterium]